MESHTTILNGDVELNKLEVINAMHNNLLGEGAFPATEEVSDLELVTALV